MDTSRPGEPLDDLAANEAGRRQVIRCALFSPVRRRRMRQTQDARWSAAAYGRAQGRGRAAGGDRGLGGRRIPATIPHLPIIGPRLYAKGQRGDRRRLPAGDWFAELNLTPTHRVVAGLGTRVVDQGPGAADAGGMGAGRRGSTRRTGHSPWPSSPANLATSVHARLAKVEPGRLLQVTRPLAPRVRLDGVALTLAGQTVRSATPSAALGGAFRRARAGDRSDVPSPCSGPIASPS